MRTGAHTPEDVRRLRTFARHVRDSRHHDRRDWIIATGLLAALRQRLDRAGPSHQPSNPRVGTRPSGNVSYHKITVHGRTFLFEHVEPLLVHALEERRPARDRADAAKALARALRYTCPTCSTAIPNAYHHSACAHLPVRDVLAAQPLLVDLWTRMQRHALG